MIKNIISISSNLNSLNSFSIELLKSNIYLLIDKEFIKKIFIKYCTSSNLEMAQYVYENGININSSQNDRSFYSTLFHKLCEKSNTNIIEWYLNEFGEFIELTDTKYLILSMLNYDRNVFKFILSKSKNFYTRTHYEQIFVYCVESLCINFIRQIYQECPEINIRVINGICLYNSLDIYTPNFIIRELKIYAEGQGYELEVFNPNIYVKKKLYIYSMKENRDIQNKLTNIGIDLVPIECVLCFDAQTNLISCCGHKFCFQCINIWVKKNYSCPTCRLELPNVKFFSLTN